MKILVIEDDYAIAMLYESIVTGMGHTMIRGKIFSDGMEAVRAGIMERPDLIIADHHLANGSITGIEACDRIRRFVDVPVMVSSGSSITITRVKISGKAEVAIFEKPFVMQQIIDWIKRIEGEYVEKNK